MLGYSQGFPVSRTSTTTRTQFCALSAVWACNQLHPTIPKPGITGFPVLHHTSLGKQVVSGTSGCTGSKATGTPCENTVPFPTSTNSFVCLVFNDSKPGLWWFVVGFALCHPVQEIMELGLTRIPHTQLGLSWDVPSLTSFLASLLMWILVLCTGLLQTQLPNSLTRQIRLKNHC